MQEEKPKEKQEKQDTWCSLAWNHLQINPAGRVRPCCRFLWDEVPDDFNLNNGRTLNELLSHSLMSETRALMSAGQRVPGCSKCYEEEDAGKRQSHRQVSNAQTHITKYIEHHSPKIQFLELATSNLCNLKCRMCGPFYSSAWNSDFQKLTGSKFNEASVLRTDIWQMESCFKDLRHVKFTGGEPFLIKEYTDLLQALVEGKHAENIYLNYSTNLTVFPSKELIELWSNFQYVELAVSLDGVGPVIEYVRHPSRWERVNEVLTHLMSLSKDIDIRVGVRPSIMIYNVLNVPDIFSYWNEAIRKYYLNSFGGRSWVNLTHVQVPEHLSLRVLPQRQKQLVFDRLDGKGANDREKRLIQHLLRYMLAKDDSHLWPQFLDYTARLDKIRGESFAALYAELLDK